MNLYYDTDDLSQMVYCNELNCENEYCYLIVFLIDFLLNFQSDGCRLLESLAKTDYYYTKLLYCAA